MQVLLDDTSSTSTEYRRTASQKQGLMVMNALRRNRLREARRLLGLIRKIVDELRREEETAFDSTPHALQEARLAGANRAAYDALTDAIDCINSLDDHICHAHDARH